MSNNIIPLVLPLGEGITLTTNWRNSDHILQANSFTFDANEFRAILEEPSIAYVRLYIGKSISSTDDSVEERMICVGVDGEEKDILPAIYDFSHPCPPLCKDNESPLAGGI